MALKTKGRPAILLLEMLKLMSFSPTAVIMSERHVDEAALRDDAVDGWRFGNVIEHKIINCIYILYCWWVQERKENAFCKEKWAAKL